MLSGKFTLECYSSYVVLYDNLNDDATVQTEYDVL